MKLVVDANIAISAIISPAGKTRELLFMERLKLHAPPFLVEEMESHGPEIIEKSNLRELDYSIAIAQLFSCISFIPPSVYISSVATATSISPDTDDIDYLALALHLQCPLWSNDKRLGKQARIQIIATHELERLLKKPASHK